MPEHEARRRAVYDHADEEPRPAGRRRRQVADWGVGEELFDGMPGARFDRRGAEHTPTRAGSIPRGGASDGRRTIVIAEDDVRVEDEAPAEEFASREDALEARRRHDAVWAGDEPFADDQPAANPFAAAAAAFETGGRFAEEPASSRPRAEPHDVVGRRGAGPAPEGIVRGGVEGRRTVKIGGRPAEFHPTPTRRPSRMIHERLGARPDRIAAWAFALGILLILIAIATANI
jgi:hypothetical protein